MNEIQCHHYTLQTIDQCHQKELLISSLTKRNEERYISIKFISLSCLVIIIRCDAG